MKKILIAFGVCFAAFIVVLIWWFIRPPQVVGQSPSVPRQFGATTNAINLQKQQENLEARRQVVAVIESALNAPITFFGKVVDQNGDPVPFARAAYGLLDKFNESGSNGRVDADVNGFFTIQGVKGAAIGVNVSKSGYYQIHKVSDQYFSYGSGGDSMSKSPPLRDNPAVFVLQKMGETEPLVRIEKSARLAKSGTPTVLDLASGSINSAGDLQIEAWTDEPEGGRKFDWRCRVTVPNGGLVERKNQFDFEAPEDGYVKTVEITMRRDAEQWVSQQQRDFFVKLPDNHYARINFTMIAGGNHYFLLEGFLNPKPGSRNLEFDPAKVVKSP